MKLCSKKPTLKKVFLLKYRVNNLIYYYLTVKKPVFFISTVLLLLTLLNGCILALPVPYHGDDPFSKEKCSFIIPNNTTKTAIKEKLGYPSAYRLGEKIYIYAGEQRDWMWLGVIGFYNKGDYFTIPTYLTHLLIIEFNKDDVVSAIQEFCGDTGELESGLYVISNGGYTPLIPGLKGISDIQYIADIQDRKWSFSDERLIIGASSVMDKNAKQFVAPSNKSVIYFYKDFSDNSEAKLDYNLSVNSGIDGFLVWVVEPGDHTISATNALTSEILTIRCYPGETNYVEHSKGIMREKHKSVAAKEIAKRRLIIDGLAMFDLDKY